MPLPPLSAALLYLTILLNLTSCNTPKHPPPQVEIPQQGITAQNIAILVKNNDNLSLETAQLYQQARNIPEAHIFYLNLPNTNTISPEQFNTLYQNLIAQVGDHIQAFVATWQMPYRVGCMSITSALAFGYDPKWCKPKYNHTQRCFPTANSPYFNTQSTQPWQDLKLRPTMLLTGKDLNTIQTLIQRGVASDGTYPNANAYLVQTRDQARSTRAPIFKHVAQRLLHSHPLSIHFIDTQAQNINDSLSFKENVMLYQTGLTHVTHLETIQFLPGAIADHLTSFGGQGIPNNHQMTAFRWLEAGATGSYGTVVEPCNFVQKFPNPAVLIPHYLQGDSLIEAYWKSVQQPGEGLFIGEPLARPYDLLKTSVHNDTLTIITNRLKQEKNYQIEEWNLKHNRFKSIQAKISYNTLQGLTTIQIKHPTGQKYKIISPTEINHHNTHKN